MSLFRDANAYYDRVGTSTADHALAPIQLPHYPIGDTALAACLGTLGIPFREPAPFTDDVDEGSGARHTSFWLGDASAVGGYAGPDGVEKPHKTEELCAAWNHRARFVAEHPLHPLNAMRDALDARAWWLTAMHTRGVVRGEPPPGRAFFLTEKIHAASVLKACGFAPLAFSGRAFFLAARHGGVPAEKLLLEASQEAGGSPPQWMARVLHNYSHLVQIAKSQSPIIRLRDGDQTLLLTADSTPKTRDKFHALL